MDILQTQNEITNVNPNHSSSTLLLHFTGPSTILYGTRDFNWKLQDVETEVNESQKPNSSDSTH